MLPYILVFLAIMVVGSIIVIFVRPDRTKLNKCLDCQHFITCDKGDPNHVCYKDQQ